MPESARRCIFCQDDRRLTNEHIWGDWVTDYVPRTVNKHDHANVQAPKPGEPDPPIVRIRAGDPLSSHVRVVCGPCNNGWMSQLQEAAKAHLIPLFAGQSGVIEAAPRTAIAAWIAMATMTGEYISRDPTRIAVTQSDRDWLMNVGTAPKDWRIWIGRYQRRLWPGQWVHSTFPVLETEYLPSTLTVDDRHPTLQTTAFVIGQLFVFAMSCVYPEIPRGWDWRTANRAPSCLRQIWPHNGGALVWPAAEMNDAYAESFATAFVKYSDDLALRVGYR
jgi:hypothetical protein